MVSLIVMMKINASQSVDRIKKSASHKPFEKDEILEVKIMFFIFFLLTFIQNLKVWTSGKYLP